LNAFLSSSGAGAPGAFDDLHFETGSATLAKGSDTQLAAVLEAYPKAIMSERAHRRHGGSRGNQEAPRRPGRRREAGAERGVSAAQIESEGRGAEQPIASNDSEAGRARNRRVELIVVKS
jgi:outer membrane protein OmpA-like peptidoglycan-associated protein